MKKFILLILSIYFFFLPTKVLAAENYFGDGSDGAVTISSNTSLTNTADGDYVVKQYSSLTINAGVTLTTQNRAKGLFIYVTGNATINGTLSMTARGANANPTGVSATGLRLPMKKSGSTDTLAAADFAGAGTDIISAVANQSGISGDGHIFQIVKIGGARGSRCGANPGCNGGNGGSIANGAGGGGGGAYGNYDNADSGWGQEGSSFSGGPGGGSGWADAGGGSGVDYGGRGGNGCGDGRCAGGAGNPGGTAGGASGNAGTGGIIWLIVGGDLTIGSGGEISVDGTAGGNDTVGGGSSGSGVIKIAYAGNLSNSGTIDVTGVAGVGSSYHGGAGGNGSYELVQVDSIPGISCQPTLGDSTHTITSDCTFTGYEDVNDSGDIVSGLDSGTGSTNTSVLTVEGGILVISSNETFVVGSIELTGGSISIATGSKIILDGALWAIDQDSDGYPATLAFYGQVAAPTYGVRLNTITYINEADCDDNDNGVGGGTLNTYYQDSDGDLYGNPSVTTEGCSPPSGYVADNTDCYDSNANAKPGQTTCYTSHRGDGSYDYDCDTISTKCTNCNLSCTNGPSFWTKGCCGTAPVKYCCNASWKAEKLPSGSAACGQAGKKPSDGRKSVCSGGGDSCSLTVSKKISCADCTPDCR